MSEVKIIYNGNQTIIEYQSNEKLEEIFKRFQIKINAENKELVYLYNGKIIEDKNIILSELTSDKIITILAHDSNNIPSNINNLVKSEYVICPICKESAILEEKDYKLKIYGCENGHINENILINQFNKTQEIDYSKIICQKCNKNNRYNTLKNEFYYCDECKINLCPICKSIHNNNHRMINYNNKWYKCDIHNKEYNSYCNKCKINICMMCENNHKEHELIYYGKLIIEDNKIIKYMKEIRKEIDIFNKNIKEEINKLNKIIENIEEYYKIINDIIEKYIKNKIINYQILININNIINKNSIINNIKIINNKNDKYNDIIDIYNKINNKINNDIFDINNKINDDNIIIYKIDENKDKIKIFGKLFVKRNKNNIKIEIEGKEYELMEYYKINNNKNLKIKIKGIENITNMGSMFFGCSSLLNIYQIYQNGILIMLLI